MAAAGWRKAAAKTFLRGLRVVETEILDGRYPDAPVSDLFLFGRRQDLAFEQTVGRAMRSRHHVRFWMSPDPDADGRPIWLGAATFDRNVGLSRRTGQVTHHIAPAVDAERDKLMVDLERLGPARARFPGHGHRPDPARRERREGLVFHGRGDDRRRSLRRQRGPVGGPGQAGQSRATCA